MPEQNTYSGPPEWMQPFNQSYLQGAFNVANRPYQQYQGMRVAPFTQGQQQAFNGIYGSMGGSQGTQAANQYLTGLLGGQGSFDLNGVIDAASRDVTSRYNQATAGITDRFNNPGNWGGARHQLAQADAGQALARGLGDANANARLQAYQFDQNQRMQAANLANTLQNSQMQNWMQGLNAGNYERQYGQGLLDVAHQDWQNQWDYPNQQVERLGNALGIGQRGAGTNTTTQTPDPNRWSQLLGLGALSLGFFGS